MRLSLLWLNTPKVYESISRQLDFRLASPPLLALAPTRLEEGPSPHEEGIQADRLRAPQERFGRRR